MKIRFANRTLERASRDIKRARRSWSTAGVAERYMDCCFVLEAVDQFEQLYLFPDLDFHALHGNRHGQYAIRLAGAWRMIVEHDATANQIVVVGVVDYHD